MKTTQHCLYFSRRIGSTGLILGLSIALTGCVTSKKYRLAKDDTPPARTLGWSISTPAAELTLNKVIIFKGPGSWKKEARWDEYLVQISNHGSQPLTIESAQLIDVSNAPQIPGGDPWKLEKISYTNWDKYGKTGLKVLAGAGAVALYGAATYSVALASAWGGAAGGGAVAMLSIIPVVALVDITAVAVMNHQNKGKVQAEFDRRRLALPLTIAPGQDVAGSFFFPMTPGPQRLIIKGRSADAPVEILLQLKSLADLHLVQPVP